ncbi:hypothetical protein NLJ89_g2442 [Agrocybe chaxingu]|uniref:Cytochrome P450 n=1 Tax=Agrocybe chaxingu TaxID=84603 RepID=A0A9W8K6K4_9AGAR|nr:hypothetical protein NLJ89_g2442 [Agrocybe chaxingu]
MPGLALIALTITVIYACRKYIAFRNAVRSVLDLPGYRVLFTQYSLVANLLPPIPGISPGSNHFFTDKYATFERTGWDISTVVAALPDAEPTVVLADAEAIKEVTSSRARFPKPVAMYEVLSLFGRNIVASEGEEWKKYRKISAPAFSDRNNKLVWDETVRIMIGLFDEVWKNAQTISVDHCVEITLPIALFVIGIAGECFGRRISWQEDVAIPPGHEMSFKDALHIVSTDIFIKMFTPEKLLGLTTKFRRIRRAFEELEMYMVEMIKERQTSEKVERHDLFTSLLEANTNDLDVTSLTESELIGNIFIFLLAGHEVVNVPKYSAEDTTLVAGNPNGEKLTVPIPKGAKIAINTPGLHYNPRYWKDPHTFKPSRFLEDWNKDAFLPFSAGARACLGRKFFETEGIAILTMLVSRYKISIKDDPKFAHETLEQRKKRVLATRNALTLTPLQVPLTFTRRA